MEWWNHQGFKRRAELKKKYLKTMMITYPQIKMIYEKEDCVTIEDPSLDEIKGIIKGTQMYQQFVIHNGDSTLLLDNLAVELLKWHKTTV